MQEKPAAGLEGETAGACPGGLCAYERYDPATLAPENEQSRTRLAELGWRSEEFQGRSVLDIGANAGLLSLHAVKLGAKAVQACDVQAPLVKYFAAIAQRKKLPIKVARRSLKDLDPQRDQADIVLFMEVLHWVVSQGSSLEDALDLVASLTREVLYIEFPWSVQEPSIRAQTTLTEADYEPGRILDLLSRQFEEVRIVRFMRYFGFRSASRRVLVRAAKKRMEWPVLARMPQARPLDITLPNARHANRVIYSPDGYFFVKRLAPESRLARISPEIVSRIFDELGRWPENRLVLPVKLGPSYLPVDPSVGSCMAFPLIGRPGDRVSVARKSLAADSFVDFLVGLNRQMAAVAPAAAGGLRDPHALRSLLSIATDPLFWSLPPCSGPWRTRIEGLIAALRSADGSQLDRLQHGDLQTGNLLARPDGSLVLVDLDNLSLGTAHSDGLTALVWYGATPEVFTAYANRCIEAGERAVAPFDVAYAAMRALHWLYAVTKGHMLEPQSVTVTSFLAGFDGLMRFDGDAGAGDVT